MDKPEYSQGITLGGDVAILRDGVPMSSEEIVEDLNAGEEPQAAKLTPLNEHTRRILGLMCFECINMSKLLRLRGDEIGNRAEEEQAAVLHFLLNMYEQHGDGWAAAASAELKRLAETGEKGGE